MFRGEEQTAFREQRTATNIMASITVTLLTVNLLVLLMIFENLGPNFPVVDVCTGCVLVGDVTGKLARTSHEPTEQNSFATRLN
jgi:hypothetical protein